MTSKIKVDNIENQCGGAVVTKCGGTTTISGTVVKSNTLQASDAGNIISQSGTTITLGASGDTINLASGASQSGFGRTGTVDWQTTIKTTGFTAVSGEGYFCNTSSGAFTLTLPASPSAGDIVSLKDYAYTFGSNNLTIGRNGSNIGGGGTDDLTISTNGSALTFIYVDGTKGWLVINESTDTSQGLNPTFITATGGTITTSGNFKIHSFTGPGTFTVCSVGNAAGSNSVDYIVVGAGGSGGQRIGGGGGAGGFREGFNPGSYIASPLATTALPVSVQGYGIVIGGGGPGGSGGGSGRIGVNGSLSSFSTITSAGGGGGGFYCGSTTAGLPGGSGGGGGSLGGGGSAGGTGNTPPVSPAQGFPGAPGVAITCGYGGGGGGGATVIGTRGCSPTSGGPGGAGATTLITASPVTYAGGGGGGSCSGAGAGGAGGGGAGSPNGPNATAGTANTGGGGGGARGDSGNSGAGGSGLVVIRYKFQ